MVSQCKLTHYREFVLVCEKATASVCLRNTQQNAVILSNAKDLLSRYTRRNAIPSIQSKTAKIEELCLLPNSTM
jgi:hypothetical protein